MRKHSNGPNHQEAESFLMAKDNETEISLSNGELAHTAKRLFRDQP